ncbi:MAG: hypothetical protein LBC82_07675 [Oscillospiraceae bacterium]|jgi:hypothetical protein|nr:hypothetical protein [Oscillospiraceae bacterium]
MKLLKKEDLLNKEHEIIISMFNFGYARKFEWLLECLSNGHGYGLSRYTDERSQK